MSNFVNILGVNVSITTPYQACDQIFEWVKNHCKVYVCVSPVSTIVDCQRDEEYRQVVNGASMVTPDGMPVVWVARSIKGVQGIERTYGPDLMLRVCDQGQKIALKHFFYGGTPQVLADLSEALKRKYPQINIVGMHAPDFKPQAVVESAGVIAQINQSHADVLWVALGSPKQDFWMSINRPVLDVPVMVGVGAAFDFISGAKPQAPRWMGRSGLEWLFRLCAEPRRLWRRYLIGNSLFIWYVVKDVLTMGKRTHA